MGASGSDSVAYSTEHEFSGKDTTIKLASSVANLSSATAISAKSLKLTLSHTTTPYFAIGDDDPAALNAGAFEASGEFVLRYDATTHEDNWEDNTAQALQIAFTSTETIGSAAHPSLIFTAPKVTLTTFEKSNDLDAIVEATVGFNCEFSESDTYMIKAILTNTQASYASA